MAQFSQPGRYVGWFTARLDGECETCYSEIREGDRVAYLEGDDRPSCEECVDDAG